MFEQMTTFIRIAEMGSITRAARSLGLSLPWRAVICAG